MAQPMIAQRTPRACAGCFGQYPDRVHVDFRAAIEGPPVNDSPRAPHIDWVVLCEDCIRGAFELLPEQANQRDAQAARIARLEAKLDASEDAYAALEDAFTARERRMPAETKAAPETPALSGRQRQRQRKPRKPRYAPTEA